MKRASNLGIKHYQEVTSWVITAFLYFMKVSPNPVMSLLVYLIQSASVVITIVFLFKITMLRKFLTIIEDEYDLDIYVEDFHAGKRNTRQ